MQMIIYPKLQSPCDSPEPEQWFVLTFSFLMFILIRILDLFQCWQLKYGFGEISKYQIISSHLINIIAVFIAILAF